MTLDLFLIGHLRKIMKTLAKPVAPGAASDPITTNHLSEAINYRTLDRSYWT